MLSAAAPSREVPVLPVDWFRGFFRTYPADGTATISSEASARLDAALRTRGADGRKLQVVRRMRFCPHGRTYQVRD